MKITIASDLHLEFGHLDPEVFRGFPRDLLILAGDLIELRGSNIEKITNWLSVLDKIFDKIIYVPGNHEFYRRTYTNVLETLHNLPFITPLYNSSIEYKGKVIYGGTMWTEMMEYEWDISQRMNDFRLIKDFRNGSYQKFRTGSARKEFNSFLVNMPDKPDIVISHHAPHYLSIDDKYKDNALNGAYYSKRVSGLLDRGEVSPKLWIHGHMHSPKDYRVNSTRVVSNPRGYHGYEDTENWKPKVITL